MGLKLINQMRGIEQDPDRIGTFHIEYCIHESWDQHDVDEMGDWLANNCTKNYIYTQDVSTIIGGGCWPIKNRWMHYVKQRAKNRWPDDINDGTITTWRIRLSKEDDMLFRLTWLHDLPVG